MLSKLIKFEVNSYAIHLHLNWFSNFGAQVKWAGEPLNFFQIKSGIR